MKTYKITYLLGKLDTTKCPPDVVSVVFPNYDGSQLVTLNESEITVTFDTAQTPVDLGALIKVTEVIEEVTE